MKINKRQQLQVITLLKEKTFSIKMWTYCFLIYAGVVYLTRGYVEAFSSDVYSSSGELINVFRMEQELIEVLENHKRKIENSLEAIYTYVGQVQEVYRNEGCWPPETCSDDILLDNIVGNPIYCYQILKRFNHDWKKMEEEIKSVEGIKTFRALSRVKNKYGGAPGDQDLQGAARALNRLQAVYRFNVTEFSRGNIMGYQTSAELDAKDTFYLGRFAHTQNKPEIAIKWLEEAALQAAADENKRVDETQVRQVIRTVKRRLPPGYYDLEDEFDNDGLEDEDGRPKYKIGYVPPKTTDLNKQVTEYDRKNLDALCRGVDLLPPSQRSKLLCYYTAENNPYFLIGPLKMEVAHNYPHEIIIFHDVISNAEADGIINLSLPLIQRAVVGGNKAVSEIRVSKNVWIEDSQSALVDKISLRINRITGLQTIRKYDDFHEGKKEEYEYFQVANYGIGGHYSAHQDPMYVYKEPTDDPVLNIEEDPHVKRQSYITGDRMATFMLYLSEVPKGGYTAFPRLGVAVAPVRGSAVFWHNIRRSGRSDMHMLHGGCPVLVGSKWVANKWVREWANAFKRKCVNHIDY